MKPILNNKIFRFAPYTFKLKLIFIINFSLFAFQSVNAQPLETLINEALKHNPEIEKLDLQHQIALEKINEVNSLPNTQFNFGFMAVKPDMDMPMDRFRVSAMQMFPWFGTIEAKKDYAHSQSKTKALAIEIAQRKLALSISNLYYLHYEMTAKQTLLEEQIALLKTYETLALNAVEVGNASAVEVLKLQIRQNDLLKQKALLNQQDQGIQAALNSLLNREKHQEILVVDSLKISDNEPVLKFESLVQNPELSQFDTQSHSVEKLEVLNHKENAPNFGIGIEYINLEKSPMIRSSFKDMVMPMLSFSMPVFNKKYKSQTKQNQLKLQEIQSQKKALFNQLKANFAKAISERNQAKITYKTQQSNLKKVKNAQEMLIKSYETGTVDFNEVLEIQALQLQFKLEQIESLKTYYQQRALLNYLTQ